MAKRVITSPSPLAPASAEAAPTPLLLVTADWQLDLAGRRLVGASGPLLLPALEFRLLLVFWRHPHRVLTRTEILDAVWGRDFAGTDRVVDQAVYWLRRALEPDPARPRYLCTRRGIGYTYCPPPATPDPDTALTLG